MANNNKEVDHVFKILLVGDSNVGKTSLLIRYTENRYNDGESTIGLDFKIKKLEIGNKLVKLQIWDTAGQEKFNTITTSYYKGAHGVIVVFDVESRQSFDSILNWLNQIRRFSGAEVSTVIIGHKSDLRKEGNNALLIDSNEAKDFAEQAGIPYFESSAKENILVDEPFHKLAEDILLRYRDTNTKRKNTVNINNNNNSNHGSNSCSC